jgi:hypothetical protein
MWRIGKIAGLCLVLASVVGLGVVAGADAKKGRTAKRTQLSSEITLQAVGPDGVTGRVSGSQKACRAQRQVTLYRVDSPGSVPNNEFVASTWTHGDGSWQVPGPMFPSEFFAVVDAKKTRQVVCSSATSNHLLWG